MQSLAEKDSLLKGVHWVQDAGACSGVYVLEEGRILIDAGNMFGLVDELMDLGPLDRLERILLTHSHFDHVGGIAEIYQWAAPDLHVHPSARRLMTFHPPAFAEFFDRLERDGKLRPLRDGDSIDAASLGVLQVLHTPGHTAGDLCFFNERSGALFCGDTVLPNHLSMGADIAGPDENSGATIQDKLAALRRLLALPVRHLLPGHGEPVLHKGADHIKLALYNVYRALFPEHPEKAWAAMGHDLLSAGLNQEAGQCLSKARESAPDSVPVRELAERMKVGS